MEFGYSVHFPLVQGLWRKTYKNTEWKMILVSGDQSVKEMANDNTTIWGLETTCFKKRFEIPKYFTPW